jgi:hypothetical protein
MLNGLIFFKIIALLTKWSHFVVMRIRDPLDELIFLHHKFCQNGLSTSSNIDILLMIIYLLVDCVIHFQVWHLGVE